MTLLFTQGHNYQSALYRAYSSETSLRVLSDLLTGGEEGHVSILTLLDLSAAFDTIDHESSSIDWNTRLYFRVPLCLSPILH